MINSLNPILVNFTMINIDQLSIEIPISVA